jgi:TonB family protein
MLFSIQPARFVILLLFASRLAFAQAPPSDSTGSGVTSSPEPPGVSRVGNGVTPPRAIYAPDPEYSEEARKEGFQGTCVLWLIVSPEGLPRDIRVKRAIGHGLDEEAVEAIKQWKFEPAQKDGKPVALQINVEVSFRLSSSAFKGEILELAERAKTGDAKAELQLSQAYFQGKKVPADESAGYRLLSQAAKQGLPEAQFEMGEYTTTHNDGPDKNIAAYMWYSLADNSHFKDAHKRLKKLASQMSSEDIVEAQKRAQNWHPQKENMSAGTNSRQ